jgi:HlyD family secretion protein
LKWTLYISSGIFVVRALLWIIPIDDVVMATGTVEPGDKVYIDSPLTRVVKKIYAWEGTRVKKGQPVALLEDHDLTSAVTTAEDEVSRTKAAYDMARARLDHLKALPFPENVRIAEARLRSAKANLENERQRYDRADSLWARKFITVSEIEAAQTRLEQARSQHDIALETLTVTRQGPSPAQIREAEAEVEAAGAAYVKAQHALELARQTLELATLRSSEDGVVVRVDLKPGMRAEAGAIVAIVAAGEGPILRAWVKETNVWKVRRSQPVEILSNVFSDREEFLAMGEVVWTYPYGTVDGGERTFEVIIKIKGAAIPLPFGSTADARVIVGRRGILKILLGFEGDVQRYAQEDGAYSPPQTEHRISEIGGKIPAMADTSGEK